MMVGLVPVLNRSGWKRDSCFASSSLFPKYLTERPLLMAVRIPQNRRSQFSYPSDVFSPISITSRDPLFLQGVCPQGNVPASCLTSQRLPPPSLPPLNWCSSIEPNLKKTANNNTIRLFLPLHLEPTIP
ncbi:UNVERIFIED_CONTAM: hypothetical protein K2H54_038705 [Gekko kuhli]